MWNKMLFGTDVYHIIHWFFIYSILGWCVESIYMSICNKKLTNRGFIHGPICPIYGVGALTVYFLLKPLDGNYIALYFCGTFLATTLEFFTGILMKRALGCVWWDYNEKPFNFKGIICLESSIAWGFYTVCLFWFLHHGVDQISSLYSRNMGKILGIFLIGYYIIDFTFSLIGAIDLNVKLKKMSELLEEIQNRLRNFNIQETKQSIKERLERSSETERMMDFNLHELAELYRRMRFHPSVFSKHLISGYQAFRVWGRKLTEREHEEE